MRQQSQRGYYAQDGGLPGLRTIPVSTVVPKNLVFPVDVTAPAPAPGRPLSGTSEASVGFYVFSLAHMAATGALAYHGYKRNDSVGWAFAWGLLGGVVWPITLPIAFAQGYGKPAVKKNRRRSRSK